MAGPDTEGAPVEGKRTGRERQRYDESGRRLVCGGVVVRDAAAEEVLLVTSQSNPGLWIVPKGGWEDDETKEEAALREAREEAGAVCDIGAQIGVFEMPSNKPDRPGTVWTMFMMTATRVLDEWAEGGSRQRRFVPVAEAKGMVKPHIVQVLSKAVEAGFVKA